MKHIDCVDRDDVVSLPVWQFLPVAAIDLPYIVRLRRRRCVRKSGSLHQYLWKAAPIMLPLTIINTVIDLTKTDGL